MSIPSKSGRIGFKIVKISILKLSEGKKIPIMADKEKIDWGHRKRWEEVFYHFAYPFPLILIDQVEDVERDQKIKTSKWVTANEFFLAGHFPNEPIMPGVLTLEGLFQSSLLLIEESYVRGKIQCSLSRVGRVRFKKAILPGDHLEFTVHLASREGDLWRFKGKAQVGNETAVEADWEMKVTLREVGFDL